TGLTPLTNYIVTVDGLYNAASLVVSPLTDAYTSDCLSNNNAIEAEVCTGRSDSTGTLNVSVSGYYSGTPFQLNVIINNSSPNNQGNPTSPISLATVPLASEVGPKGNSYYHKAGLDPAKWYIVSMTGLSSNINLDVYSDTGFSVGLCSSSKLLIEDEACVTQPSGSGDLYVQADGLNSSVGSTYSINVVETTVPPDETVSDAFANWAFPYAGSVGPGGVTEYTISGLGTTEAYSVTVSGITDIVTIEVEEEFVSKCDVFGSKIVDFACEFPVTTGTIVIRVTDMSSWGANFNLTVVSTGTAPVNQGTSMTPLDISSGLSGTVARDGTSYFVITGLTANHLYNVAFTETKGSASYRLYDASGFVSSVCYSSYTYTDRSCEGSTNASGELYIKVLDYSGAMGSTFDFVLTPTIPAPVNEGTAAAPIDVTGALPRASEVGASGDSFYVITGLSPGASVVLSSRNAYDDVVYLAVYNDSGFSSNLCTSYGTSVQGAQFCDFTVPVGGTVYVQASDPTGYQIDLILGSTFTLGFE
ncbi:MAG: hypothetical protein OEX00_09090, partial [Gammaproteobacteria bacterium]|nr:hypothetical protein [Gammaproteobacteria bacterium]